MRWNHLTFQQPSSVICVYKNAFTSISSLFQHTAEQINKMITQVLQHDDVVKEGRKDASDIQTKYHPVFNKKSSQCSLGLVYRHVSGPERLL